MILDYHITHGQPRDCADFKSVQAKADVRIKPSHWQQLEPIRTPEVRTIRVLP